MGVQMLVIIAVFTWAGSRLDQRAAIEKPIYTAVLSLLGVIIAIYTVLKDFIHKDDA
ncbi:MAG: AtpZ/AtpI family protein [Bacteroidales bacterium]|nr:AtpZ/AtpI family protein [Bacteroidales bacterium]